MTNETHSAGVNDRRAPARQEWHLKKEINVSIIISVLGVALSGIFAYTDLKRDIALIKADNLVLHQRDTQQNIDSEAALGLIRAQYEKLDGKIDRLIERTR